MADQEQTPNHKLHALGGLSLEDRLGRIEDLLKVIVGQLAAGETMLTNMNMRLRALEFIVYGACGLGLVALLGAVIALVVHKGVP